MALSHCGTGPLNAWLEKKIISTLQKFNRESMLEATVISVGLHFHSSYVTLFSISGAVRSSIGLMIED